MADEELTHEDELIIELEEVNEHLAGIEKNSASIAASLSKMMSIEPNVQPGSGPLSMGNLLDGITKKFMGHGPGG